MYNEENISSYVESRNVKAFHKIIIYVYNIIENKNVECCEICIDSFVT